MKKGRRVGRKEKKLWDYRCRHEHDSKGNPGGDPYKRRGNNNGGYNVTAPGPERYMSLSAGRSIKGGDFKKKGGACGRRPRGVQKKYKHCKGNQIKEKQNHRFVWLEPGWK